MKKRTAKKSQAQKLRDSAQSDHAKAKADFYEDQFFSTPPHRK